MCISRMLWRRQQRLIEREILQKVREFIDEFNTLQRRVDRAMGNAREATELDVAMSFRSQQVQLATSFGFDLAKTVTTV